MYVLRSTLVWIFVIGSATCSDLSVPDYDSASLTFELELADSCNAVRECSDCKTSKLCIPGIDGFKQVALISCDSNPETPYCDLNSGLCTSVAPNGCDSKDFICPSVNGTYPDPNSCTRYHICVNGFRTTNVCPINNVYDHSLGECKLSRRSSDCVVTDCRGQEGKNFVYAKDDRIYGTCVNGKPYLVGRCKDYEKYDVSLGRCVRVCRGPGTQPTEQCQQYIRCAQTSWNKYEPVLQYCACDKGYDEETGVCTPDVSCMKNIPNRCKLKPLALPIVPDILSDEDEAQEDSSDDSSSDEEQDVSDSSDEQEISPFIINNSNNQYSKNNVSNGDDTNNGNIINGNDNGNNSNSGNVGNAKSRSAVFIINNSGNSGINDVSNGDDSANGNIVNGNNNDNNSNNGNVGNVAPSRPGTRPFIINNSDNGYGKNEVSNGDDSNNGNIVNGNGNSNNANGGDVGNVVPGRPGFRPFIINNSDNKDSSNNVSNGDDNNNGNIVNGNGNSNNANDGDVGNVVPGRPGFRPFIINNSDNGYGKNEVSNGDDSNNGNIINGNGNSNNSNKGNVANHR